MSSSSKAYSACLVKYIAKNNFSLFSNISFKKYCLSLVAIAVVVVVVIVVVVVVVVVAVVVVERALLFQLNEKNDFEVIF